MKPDHHFKRFSLSLTWAWLFVFSLLPFGLVLVISLLSRNQNQLFSTPFTLNNYHDLINPLYLRIFAKSFWIAGTATFFCLLAGYPVAYMLARMHDRIKNFLILLIIIPFWTSSLIRSYALIAIIKAKGLLNTLLLSIGIIHQPLSILFTNTAVIIGLVYNLLPFMILPILTNIERLDGRLIDAARDLGANRFTTFRRVIIPLTMPGIISGCILVFLPAMTLFYIPDILGGAKSILLGNLIQNQFLIAQNWTLGGAFSAVLTLLLAVLVMVYWLATSSDKPEDTL